MTTMLILILSLLGAGIVFVTYGTIAKNSWGINVRPISCPRCNTPLSTVRQPQNIRQTLWGGWTCIKCGAEVDKCGREVVSQKHEHPPPDTQPKKQMRRELKKRIIILTAVGFLSLTLLSDLVERGDHPLTLASWIGSIGAAAIESMVFTLLFCLSTMYLLDRFFFKE